MNKVNSEKLNSENLKKELWQTLKMLKTKKLPPLVANSVAAQAREIIRIVTLEIAISKILNEKPEFSVTEFIKK